MENTYTNKLSIKFWAEGDRPREKLLAQGRQSLSDAELIAILLGSGNREQSAVEVAQMMLHSCENNLIEMARKSVVDLTKFKGIGEAKAISVVAALELGRRREDTVPLDRKKISSSKEAYKFLYPALADKPYEEFWVLLLNRNNKILSKHLISRGGISGTVADSRLIFKKAIDQFASCIILCHNHPSGSVRPSNADINLTKRLVEAGKLLEVLVIDHIIVGDEDYYSFADNGQI